MLIPRPLGRQRRRLSRHADVEDRCRDDEQAEEHDLAEEPGDDDVFADFDRTRVLACQQSGAAPLRHEGQDVAGDEDSCQPGAADEEGLVAVDHEYDAAEFHVDRCGEEGWSDEQEQALDYVGSQLVGAGILGGRKDPADVADCFDWMVELNVS